MGGAPVDQIRGLGRRDAWAGTPTRSGQRPAFTPPVDWALHDFGPDEASYAPCAHTLSDVFADPRFGALLYQLSRRGMTRASFAALPMPAGCSPDDTWALLASIRRRQGVHYYDTCAWQGRQVCQWFTPTASIQSMLADLSSRTQVGSRLDVALSERHGRRFIVRSLIEEAVAALSCDGLTTDYETARAITTGDRAPSTPIERLVANTHALLTSIVDHDAPEITPDLIERMYAQLVDGVDFSGLTSGIAWGQEWPEDPMTREQALAEICAMASGSIKDPAEHPIVMGQKLTCKVWKNPAFPTCTYILGSLLTRLYMKREGYPVFAYIPSSSTTLAWKSGSYTSDRVVPYHQAGVCTAFDRDWTMYWESCLYLLVQELDKLEAYVFELKAADDALLARLADDRSFNKRQSDVLRRCILAPDTALRIEEHRATYELAYSTARQDLLALTKLGYLEMRYEGKAQVFAARRDLKPTLARRYEQG